MASRGMRRATVAIGLTLVLAGVAGFASAQAEGRFVDVLIRGGHVLDGGGNPWVARDIGVTGDRISFVGQADAEGVQGRETIDARGLLITPGFIDMHSHASPDDPEARKMLPQLYQGITTVVIGVDGGGEESVAEDFARYRKTGIGANVVTYVGFNAARLKVMGMSDKPATPAQIRAMQDYIDRGMRGGAVGMSSGLFYTPATYAKTDEVIEVARASGKYHGIYDTHDRDLGAVYHGIGYLASTAEAIEIGEKSGNRVIFSHFSPQSRNNYGRAPEGAMLIEAARARGVDVMAAQHPYTATLSDLFAYALPTWAVAGGRDAMLKRFADPQTRERMRRESEGMLEIRGGAQKIVFTDSDPELNGLSLQQVAGKWGVSPFDAVVRIASQENKPFSMVMNIDLYDAWNIRYLARQEWMMTCTDGFSTPAGKGTVHPRSFGAFAKKLRDLVFEEQVVSLPFAIRGMTGLAADFLGLSNRGLIKEGFYADINVFDPGKFRDRATYAEPQRYSEGMVDVLINGQFAFKGGAPTSTLAGRPIARGDR
jgi:N-acyl-D-amino-acid deacylase